MKKGIKWDIYSYVEMIVQELILREIIKEERIKKLN